MKRRAVHAFFRRACEAVKQLFPCCDPDRVQPPKAEPDLNQSQLVLPEQDQVSADLQSSPEEEGPSEIQAHDAVLSGSVPGPVSGSVPGPVSGSVPGSVSGSVPGPVSGSVPGSESGSVPGSVSGSVPGPVSGSFPGSVSGPVSLIVSETAPDTVLPDPEIQLPQGESLLLYFCSILFSLYQCSIVEVDQCIGFTD